MSEKGIVGWTKDLNSRVNHLYAPHTRWQRLQKSFVKLPTRFDFNHDELKQLLNSIRSKYSMEPIIVNPKTGKRRRTYRGIGLTSKEKSTDPLYEAARYYDPEGSYKSSARGLGIKNVNPDHRLSADEEREFVVANQIAPEFVARVRNLFSKWSVSKIRLMELMPGGVVPPHYDHPYYEQIRLHTVIESNKDVFWEVDGYQFQIPDDGSLYWFDAGLIHSVYNFGKTPRTVLSFHLEPNTGHQILSSEVFMQSLISGDL